MVRPPQTITGVDFACGACYYCLMCSQQHERSTASRGSLEVVAGRPPDAQLALVGRQLSGAHLGQHAVRLVQGLAALLGALCSMLG